MFSPNHLRQCVRCCIRNAESRKHRMGNGSAGNTSETWVLGIHVHCDRMSQCCGVEFDNKNKSTPKWHCLDTYHLSAGNWILDPYLRKEKTPTERKKNADSTRSCMPIASFVTTSTETLFFEKRQHCSRRPH